jgi:hypothetical protein
MRFSHGGDGTRVQGVAVSKVGAGVQEHSLRARAPKLREVLGTQQYFSVDEAIPPRFAQLDVTSR